MDVLKWPMDSILIIGRSIGTGPAVDIASKSREVLEGGYVVLPDVLTFLADMVYKSMFPSLQAPRYIAASVFVYWIH